MTRKVDRAAKVAGVRQIRKECFKRPVVEGETI